MESLEHSIEEKVAFLSRPESYPGRAGRVEIRQTHMSWVFLTGEHAWKLKKPVRTDYLDFSTPEARRLDCLSEVRLNRRLAKDVYLRVVPLTIAQDGALCIGGRGHQVDSLVLMRRLPDCRMLDHLIRSHNVSDQEVLALTSHLDAFYKRLRPAPITGPEYRKHLDDDLQSVRKELTGTSCGIVARVLPTLTDSQLGFLHKNPGLFDTRVHAGRIVEGHGDLRPEHICLEQKPAIIDCLEFNRSLRTLDTASELTFLALECERLGAPDIGDVILRKYQEETGDYPPPALLTFYKVYHACIRARIAIWHLKDGAIPDREVWIAKAARYLSLVCPKDKAA